MIPITNVSEHLAYFGAAGIQRLSELLTTPTWLVVHDPTTRQTFLMSRFLVGQS